jgi:hypothetical protein
MRGLTAAREPCQQNDILAHTTPLCSFKRLSKKELLLTPDTFLRKHVLHPPQQRPVLRLIFHRRQFSQLSQQLALAFIQLPGCLDSHLDVKIAFAVAIEHGHAFAPYAKRGSGLRAFRNLQLVLTLQRRNHNLDAERSLRKRNRNHAVQVVALAFKKGVLFHVQDDIQVASGPTERARLAESGETNSRAVLHSRGHFGFHHAIAQQATLAFALRAGIGDYAARALASRAGSSDAEEALLIPHLTPPVTRLAADRRFPRCCAGSPAGVACLMATDIHLFLNAEDRLVKFEVQVFAKVGSALGATATTAALAENVAEAKDVAKDVAEILEDRGIESSRTSATTAHARVPEAVIQRSFLAVREDCVRLRDLFEPVFRFRIVGVAVGVVRHRELAVSALDFNFGGRAGDTKYLVIITFRVGGQKLPPLFSQLNQSDKSVR